MSKKLSESEEREVAGGNSPGLPEPPYIPTHFLEQKILEPSTIEKCRYCNKDLDHKVTATTIDLAHDKLKACCGECKSKILEFYKRNR